MGYRCSTRARHMWGVICKMYRTDGHPDILTIKEKQYFFQRGPEQSDGAITGTLYQILPENKVETAGNVRIEADGIIDAFPKMSPAYKRECESIFFGLEEKNPAALDGWAAGTRLWSETDQVQ